MEVCADDFIQADGPIFDVRSPGEYAKGHIPGAHSLPLFSDEERAIVGTTYKQQGATIAFDIGLEIVSPKLPGFVQQTRKLAVDGVVRLYCWRGGLRSHAFAGLLGWAGMRPQLLLGGYKAFRRWTSELFSLSWQFLVIGGLTGVGKTEILRALGSYGEQILDLEALANHKGSVYGATPMEQPSCEQFENELAMSLKRHKRSDPIWVEDESATIGSCRIPEALFEQILQAKLFSVSCSHETRIERLVADYGSLEQKHLIEGTARLKKRIGSERCRDAILAITNGELRKAVEIILPYYDELYMRCQKRRLGSHHPLPPEELSAKQWAIKLKGFRL